MIIGKHIIIQKITKLEGLKNLNEFNESINLKSNISQIKMEILYNCIESQTYL